MGCGTISHKGKPSTPSNLNSILGSHTSEKIKKTEALLGPLNYPLQEDSALKYLKEKENAEGGYYEGQIRGGDKVFEGLGTIIYPRGEKYQGYFKNGQRNGKGRQIWMDGSSYQGVYMDGARHGHGVYSYANGDKYDGGWCMNEKEGKGVYYKADGSVFFDGIWKYDNPSS